jgi:hypothetical protein
MPNHVRDELGHDQRRGRAINLWTVSLEEATTSCRRRGTSVTPATVRARHT